MTNLTKAVLEKAIATSTPIMVRDEIGSKPFALTVEGYDRRMVRGSYNDNGTARACVFHRADLAISAESW